MFAWYRRWRRRGLVARVRRLESLISRKQNRNIHLTGDRVADIADTVRWLWERRDDQ